MNLKTSWTLELLKSIEWKRYEEVCNEWLIMRGYNAQLINAAPDDGIDIKIIQNNNIICIAQCKAWKSDVGIDEMREFYGVMCHKQINSGIFFSASEFTQAARKFCDDIPLDEKKRITLINSKTLLEQINMRSEYEKYSLYRIATKGDYITPTCKYCNVKMIKKNGVDGQRDFWGCPNFKTHDCRYKIQISESI